MDSNPPRYSYIVEVVLIYILTYLKRFSILISVDVAAIAKIFGKEVERDNVRYMTADRLLVDFKLRNSRFKVKDTVNHGSVIGEWIIDGLM